MLNLIAKVLSFTDEQLETVGLKVPSKNIFTALISSFTPQDPGTAAAALEVRGFVASGIVDITLIIVPIIISDHFR